MRGVPKSVVHVLQDFLLPMVEYGASRVLFWGGVDLAVPTLNPKGGPRAGSTLHFD